MKGWKKNTSELIRWEMKGVPVLYPVAFIIFLIPILFWNIKNILSFDAFTIDDTSARYLLSALVQSLAAIIAIVVTLTLVAVQLSASAYSPRVIDIFKKDWIMWLLLVWYGLSIFFGLFVLEMIGGEYQNLSRWGVSLELCVFLAYLMGIIAFAGLFWHIGNVIKLLKPETIIKRLSENITKENVLKHIESVKENKKDRTKPIEEDPIQPIMDIIHSSVMKYDIATTRVGLGSVTDRAIEIIDLDGEEEKKISKYVCDRFERVSRLTVSKMDEESTGEVIRNLGTFGKLTAEKGLGYATSQVAWSLKDVGELTAEREFEDATCQVAKSLRDVGKAAAKRAEQWFEGATIEVIVSLGDVGEIAAKKRLDHATRQVAKSLRDVGKIAVEKELKDAPSHIPSHIVQFLHVVGKAAAEKRLDHATFRVAESLGVIGEIAAERGLDNVISQTAESLGDVGMTAARNELEDATVQAAQSLAELTISSKEIVKNVIQRLKQQYQGHWHFDKFMKLYVKYLEKLRTKTHVTPLNNKPDPQLQ